MQNFQVGLRDTVLNNKDNVDILKYAVTYLKDYTKFLGSEKRHDYIDFLVLDFNLNNEVENALFINKLLIVSNSYIDRLVFLSNRENFRFTCLNSIVRFDNFTGVYKKGDDVKAYFFIAAEDTTINPLITLGNGEVVDTFNSSGWGIYKTKADKRGINTIEGNMGIKDEYTGETYKFPFLNKYLVK